MAIQLSTAYVAQFDAEVKQAYQGTSVLRGTVRTRTGVVGSTHRFTKIGKGAAQPHVPQSEVTPIGASYATKTATLSDWDAPEYSDIFMQAKVNFDERRELVQVVGNAIGRRFDQLIIAAMYAASSPETVANDIGGTDSNLNVTKLIEAKRLLDKNNVPPGDRFILVHANNLAGMLAETQVTSSDFNTVKALVQGQVDTFLGFKFITIGDRDEGGLTLATNDRSVLAWHRTAVGLAEGIAPRTEINYIPTRTSFLVNAMFSAGAVDIDDEGIVVITCDEA